MSSDDPLARRRSVTLAQAAQAALSVDARTGSTTRELWPADGQPEKFVPIRDVDDWLDRFRVFWTHKLESLATEVARGKKERGE